MNGMIGEASLAVRNLILEQHAVNSCIESTRLGLLVFERLGIPARPQPVKVTIMNRQAWKLVRKRVPYPQWPDTAHALGVGFHEDDNPDGWSGHLVAILREPGEPRYIIDISSDQFDRPGRFSVPGPVGTSITNTWTPVDPIYRVLEDENTILDYRPFAPNDPVGNAYKTTTAWTADPEWFDSAADRVVKELGA